MMLFPDAVHLALALVATQARPVQAFAYLCPGTIEQRIGEILAEKRALFADLVDDVAVAGLRHLDLPTLLRAVGF